MPRHSQLKRSADMLARSLDHLAQQQSSLRKEMRPFEALSLMVGAELIRMVPPMRLAEAITEAQKKFESFATGSESNQTKQKHTTEEMKMATKKAKGKTKNRVSNSGPGTPSNRKKLHMNSCTSKNGCHEIVHEDNTPATDQEIAEAETAGQF